MGGKLIKLGKTCLYVPKKTCSGYYSVWATGCGREVTTEAPEVVGISFISDPDADGEYCRYCGNKILVLGGNKPVTMKDLVVELANPPKIINHRVREIYTPRVVVPDAPADDGFTPY